MSTGRARRTQFAQHRAQSPSCRRCVGRYPGAEDDFGANAVAGRRVILLVGIGADQGDTGRLPRSADTIEHFLGRRFDFGVPDGTWKQQHRRPRSAGLGGKHRMLECRPEVRGIGDLCDGLRDARKEGFGVDRTADAGGVLKGAAALTACRRLADQGEHRHRLRIGLGDPHGEVHHAAAGRRAAHSKAAVNPCIPVGHEGGTGFRLGHDRAQSVRPKAVDGVVQVLDVGAADAKNKAHVDSNQRLNEGIGELHLSPPHRVLVTTRLEIARELQCIRVPPARLLLEAFEADRLEITRDRPLQP